ncbi:MAG TPA: DUF427 domain-containing protein [Acidimicrobiales bacterium]
MEKPRMERSAKRVRAYLGGVPVVDTTRAWLVWERPWAPVYWYPAEDVAADVVDKARRPDPADEPLAGHVSFAFEDVDAWFEEDEEIFAHVRDPYHRVDVLPSSRHVVVEVDGVAVADSTHAHALFETGLPTRWYLPKVDVRMDLLEPSATRTRCPYKGEASYWSVRVGDTVHEDVVWGYPAPLPESLRIAGKVAFYDEKVDVTIDGVRQERPRSPFA